MDALWRSPRLRPATAGRKFGARGARCSRDPRVESPGRARGPAPSARLDFSGRGINLFKGLQQNFRAIVSRGGGGRALAALMLRSDARRRVSKQVPAGRDGRKLRVRRNPGRGINLFKGLRRIFRAIVGRRGGGRTLTALMLRSDAKRRVSKQVPAGRDGRQLRVRRKPGRGINLFKGLRRIFRVIVSRRRLSPDLVKGGRAGPGSRRIRAADGFGGHRNAGRGFNLFKGLQQNFRAIVGRRDGGRALAALMLRSDAKRRVSKQVPAGRDGRNLRVRRNPGRGINLFKGLQRKFRATVTLSVAAVRPCRLVLRSGAAGVASRGRLQRARRRLLERPSRRPLRGLLGMRSWRGRPSNLSTVSRRKLDAAVQRPAIGHGRPSGGRPGTRRLGAAALGGDKSPMIAVELADDCRHPVDRLEVHPRHREGDERRLVETADLDRCERLRRMRHGASPRIPVRGVAADGAHPPLA